MNNDLKDILDNKELKDLPFRVPENYFDTLTERIMANIPEEPKTVSQKEGLARIFSLRPLRWAASIACIVAISATSVLYITRSDNKPVAVSFNDTVKSPVLTINEDAVSEAVDYTMLDNQDIYMMLTED